MNKRKRETQDLSGRAAPGLTQDAHDFTNQYINEDATESNDSNVDFASVLQQHDHHTPTGAQSLRTRPGDNGPGQAMAPYHTMTVPQPTEQAFLNQSGENGDRAVDQTPISQHHSADFTSEVGYASRPEDQSSGNGGASPGAANATSGTKPAVGTEEWHKIRKDNHKEGQSQQCHGNTNTDRPCSRAQTPRNH